MSQQNNDDAKALDEELGRLRDLIEKENDMLRKMIKSLDVLEKKMVGSGKKESDKNKKSQDES
jgi:hypothetical protein